MSCHVHGWVRQFSSSSFVCFICFSSCKTCLRTITSCWLAAAQAHRVKRIVPSQCEQKSDRVKNEFISAQIHIDPHTKKRLMRFPHGGGHEEEDGRAALQPAGTGITSAVFSSAIRLLTCGKVRARVATKKQLTVTLGSCSPTKACDLVATRVAARLATERAAPGPQQARLCSGARPAPVFPGSCITCALLPHSVWPRYSRLRRPSKGLSSASAADAAAMSARPARASTNAWSALWMPGTYSNWRRRRNVGS